MKKLFIVSLLFSLMCCQKEDLVLEKSPFTKEPIVIGKRLAFRSKDDLNHFINESKTEGFSVLKTKMAKLEEKGFLSLLPTFESTDSDKVNSYLERKRINNPSAREEMSVDADDDVIISDPNFAIVVNDEREIIVENDVYKFTEFGVLYTEVDNYTELQNYYGQMQNCELALSEGETYIGNDVYGFIPEPIDDICAYEIDYSDVAYTAPPPVLPAKEQFMLDMQTCEYKENVLDKVFGPSEKCIDKFSSDRRIKTRAWNQNFFVYSSVGIKTKTQKRTLRIWWASDSDEIELGYEVAKYRFDGVNISGILSQIRANSNGLNYVYSYNGYLLNQYGIIASNNNWGSGVNLFNRWPITDEDTRVLKIYLGDNITNFIEKIDAGATTIDGKQVNSVAKALAKQGWDAVSKYLKKESSGGTVIVGGNPDQQKFYFVYTDWKNNNKDDNKISKIFDFNTAQIGFTLNPGTGSGSDWDPSFTSSKSYKEFVVSCYGIGRRGSEWRGGRIILVQKK